MGSTKTIVSPINVISGRTPGRRSRAFIHVDMAELACKYVASRSIGEYGALARGGTSSCATRPPRRRQRARLLATVHGIDQRERWWDTAGYFRYDAVPRGLM